MVGRESELGVLVGALTDGRAGRPRVVVVRGDAGLGKSRLVQEALRAVSTAPGDGPPLVVATAQCVDLGSAGTPFGPLRWQLRDLLVGVGREAFVAAAPAAVLAAVAPLLPDLGHGPADDAPRPALVNDAVEVLVAALSVRHHVVLVVEDVHWADAATLALLRSLAKSLRGEHLTMLVTLRSDEVVRPPLRPAIAELERGRATTLVELAPLDDDLVRAQAAAILLPAGLLRSVDSVVQRSGGNPFFVEELLHVGDGPLPETMREVILARCLPLDPRARQVLRVLAVGGGAVEHDVLREVVDLTEAALDASLRQAADVKLVVVEGTRYRFRHALIQEALYDDVLPGERVRLHAAFARAMDARAGADASPDVAETALHWRRAREPRRALAAYAAALREAAATGAYASVADLTEACAQVWPSVEDAPAAADSPLWRLLLEAALVHVEFVSDAARGLDLARRALELCPPAEPSSRARLMWLQRMFGFNSGAPADPGLLTEAERLLRDRTAPEDQVLLARVLGLSVIVGDTTGQEAWSRVEQALALAQAAGDGDTVAYCQTVRGRLLADRLDVPAAVDSFLMAERSTEATHHLAHTRQYLICYQTHLGRYDEAVATGERALAGIRAAGAGGGWVGAVASRLVWACMCAGQAERAVRLAVTTPVTDLPMRVFVWWMQATHHVWNGPADHAAQFLEHVREDPSLEEHEAYRWPQLAADLHLRRAVEAPARWEAEVDAALTEVARLLTVRAEFEPMRFEAVPTVARAVGAWRRLGRYSPRAEEVLELLRADLPGYGVAEVWRSLVDAELATSRLAPEAWAHAVAVLDRVPAPAWYPPYALYRWGEVALAAGDRATAADALSRCTDLGPRVGASVVAGWAQRLAARGGLRGAVVRRGTPAVTGIASLSAREVQVLELVAAGLTNPQIAQRLFISPRTAGVHVAAILRKTGTATRAEAAVVWAERRDDGPGTHRGE